MCENPKYTISCNLGQLRPIFLFWASLDAVSSGLSYEPHNDPPWGQNMKIFEKFKKRQILKKVRRLAIFVNFGSRIVISIEIHVDLPNLS